MVGTGKHAEKTDLIASICQHSSSRLLVLSHTYSVTPATTTVHFLLLLSNRKTKNRNV